MSATTSPVSIRVEHDLREDFEIAAREEDRSLSYLIKVAMRDWLQRRKAAERRK